MRVISVGKVFGSPAKVRVVDFENGAALVEMNSRECPDNWRGVRGVMTIFDAICFGADLVRQSYRHNFAGVPAVHPRQI